MRALLLNQAFHPDSAATAQHATDLALKLASTGHHVTALAGRNAYGRPEVQYSMTDEWQGVHITRVGALDLGKASRWRRALNFGSFVTACAWRLARMPRFDAVITMTTPPLISFLGALFTRLKGGELHLWVMDLNPDEAIAAGWLPERGPVTRLLNWMNRYSLARANRVIVLDRFMKARIENKIQLRDLCVSAVNKDKILPLPPGARDHVVRYDPAGRREFRERFGLTSKYVIMYSGNHSPCHPLDTLLAAAQRLREDPRFAFCFVGGGSEFPKVEDFARANKLANIVCLPYQPQECLSASLSAADLHAVVMGDAFVGIVHPSKIYNVLALAIPVLYIGPPESHITDLAPAEAEGRWFFPARHGEAERVVRHILTAETVARQGDPSELAVAARFRHDIILDQLCTAILGERAILPVKTKAASA